MQKKAYIIVIILYKYNSLLCLRIAVVYRKFKVEIMISKNGRQKITNMIL